ncbi:hypothetical protein [Lactobacillus corticis]|uniref:Uncharacterized protein n=1 Tax=Lactobacillus corticis TaxID=2201249 RepID=A0A916QJH6_9LACO|nr:hypothetical protein [Lactobacillus corticis]GFZ27743.1 hypothetical protein LCB40_16230 [Lactobacillus corticis]
MVEKRSDYRKKSQKKKWQRLTSAFGDDHESGNSAVDVNPDFLRDEPKRHADHQDFNDQQFGGETRKEEARNFKANRLKRRLNWAIGITLVLIVLVLLALFYL